MYQGCAQSKRNKRERGYRVHFVSNSCPSPYKNANFDTLAINISVLVLCPKCLQTRRFRHFSMFLSPLVDRYISAIIIDRASFPIPALSITQNSFIFSEGFICKKIVSYPRFRLVQRAKKGGALNAPPQSRCHI